MKHIVMRAEYAYLIQPCVSTEETRYYLCGFQVEASADGGVLIVATNGEVMGIFHDAQGHITAGETAIVRLPKTMLNECKPKPRLSTTERWLVVDWSAENTNGEARVVEAPIGDDPRVVAELARTPGAHVVTTVYNVLIDGGFPDWRRAMPTASGLTVPPQQVTWFKSHVRNSVQEVATRCATVAGTRGASPVAYVEHDGPQAPYTVLIATRRDFVGVAMPSPYSDALTTADRLRPSWLARGDG
jgi:hypothetical protein